MARTDEISVEHSHLSDFASASEKTEIAWRESQARLNS